MTYKRMNDVFKINNPDPPANYPRYFDWTAYGIFNALAERNAPWATVVLDHAQLDEYYAATRGMKIISELSHYVYFDLNVHPATGRTQLEARNYMLAVTLLTKFGEKWSRLWTLRNIEYSPLENYNMVESGDSQNVKTGSISRGDTGTVTDLHTGTDTMAHSGTDTVTETGTDTMVHSGTDTVTETGTDTITKSGSETHAYEGGETKTTTMTSDQTDNSIWGFDSTSPVPADRSDRSGLSSEETAYSKTGDTAGKRQDVDTFNNRQDQETKNLSTATQHGETATNAKNLSTATQHGETATNTKNLTDTQTRNISGTETYNNVKDAAEHTLRRSGNIGVTTSQQMAVSELDLWSAFDYFEIVMKDIDSVLTIGIY